jgi:spore coat polysaccharide biosynthesis protein SpsF
MNIAVIQARMASRRLPGKAMLEIIGQPLIEHVIRRASRIEGVAKIFLATSKNHENIPLAEFTESLGIEVYRGDEDNVLERFYEVAKGATAQNVIRLTGDNPLLDFRAIGYILGKHQEGKYDYTCVSGLPVGAGADIFSFKALEESYCCGNGKELCDHVDLYVLENLERFKAMRCIISPGFGSCRWTVDDPDDLQLIRGFCEKASAQFPGVFDALDAAQLIALVEKLDFKLRMQPVNPNVSEKNLYTEQLAAKIFTRLEIAFDKIYPKSCIPAMDED